MDLEDLLFVTYEPSRLTIDDLLDTVKQEGFTAEVRAGA